VKRVVNNPLLRLKKRRRKKKRRRRRRRKKRRNKGSQDKFLIWSTFLYWEGLSVDP